MVEEERISKRNSGTSKLESPAARRRLQIHPIHKPSHYFHIVFPLYLSLCIERNWRFVENKYCVECPKRVLWPRKLDFRETSTAMRFEVSFNLFTISNLNFILQVDELERLMRCPDAMNERSNPAARASRDILTQLSNIMNKRTHGFQDFDGDNAINIE